MIPEIAAVILAGGRSSRLGTFKPIVRLAGRPLIHYALEIAALASRPCIIVSDRAQSEAIMKVVGENKVKIMVEPKDASGEADEHNLPLPFTSALSNIPEDLIFLMGCDTPFLDPFLPKILSRHMGDSPAVVPVWPNGYLEPLAALYRKESLSKIKSATSLRDLLSRISAKTVAIDTLGVHPESFLNINTPSDLEKAEAILRKRNKEIK